MSKWFGVHNDEDEVAHEMPRPEVRYEQPRANLNLTDYNGRSLSAGRGGDRAGETTGTRLGRGRVQGNAKSTRIGLRVLSQRSGKRIRICVLTLHREHAAPNLGV